MPTNYALRTPIYAQATSTLATTQSAKLLLYNSGSLIYTIIKSATQNVPVIFEVAELLRDYLTISFPEDPTTPYSTQSITLLLQSHSMMAQMELVCPKVLSPLLVAMDGKPMVFL